MQPFPPPPPADGVSRRDTDQATTARANRSWWDASAATYYAEHGAFLGDADLLWGPEGYRESAARLLGALTGLDVLEIGCGAAQGARYVASRGARVVASDLSTGMLAQARAVDARLAASSQAAGGGGAPRPVAPAYVHCDGAALPFADHSFDLVFAAYGAVPFVADSARLMTEAARVLRPGGRFVFSTTHPIRWSFPDAPDEHGLVVTSSYFDRRPYVETRGSDTVYVEHHRTFGDRVREIHAAGLVLTDVVEPEWPDDLESVWGGWSPLRGRLIPGTAIFVTRARS